jgi:transcriptional regulator GlxA family with amidase domain
MYPHPSPISSSSDTPYPTLFSINHSIKPIHNPLTQSKRWVTTDNGKIWTSSGVTAGMDCFLAFLEEAYGTNENGVSWADQASASMEYVRVKDPQNDPFAVLNGVEDVPSVE